MTYKHSDVLTGPDYRVCCRAGLNALFLDRSGWHSCELLVEAGSLRAVVIFLIMHMRDAILSSLRRREVKNICENWFFCTVRFQKSDRARSLCGRQTWLCGLGTDGRRSMFFGEHAVYGRLLLSFIYLPKYQNAAKTNINHNHNNSTFLEKYTKVEQHIATFINLSSCWVEIFTNFLWPTLEKYWTVCSDGSKNNPAQCIY